MEPNYDIMTIDVETTQNGKDYSFPATPHHPDNDIVLFGAKHVGLATDILGQGDIAGWRYDEAADRPGMYVGHNLKFDLLYLSKWLKCAPRDILRKAVLWDTGVVEYLLQGMNITSPTLEDVASAHGIPFSKNTAIVDMFNKGIGSDTINADPILGPMLRTYLKDDVETTENVFLKQAERIDGNGQMPLIQAQMMALKAYIEMEHNGIAIDKDKLAEIEARWGEIHSLGLANVDVLAKERGWPVSKFGMFNPTSSVHLGLMLFGGEYPVEMTEVVGSYKNGKPKTKKVMKKVRFAPHTGLVENPTLFTSKGSGGQWKLDETTLSKIQSSVAGLAHHGSTVALIDAVLSIRKATKVVNTYVKNLWANIMPDGKVHANINQTITRTGRLSSSGPNLQNQDLAITEAFVSRWGEKGRLVEVDWGQLEVVALAIRTGDRQLLDDLRSGQDIHSVLYSQMYGRAPSKEERKRFKPLTFALIYGAGPNKMSEQSGIGLSDVKLFIKTFYSRYDGVRAFHNKVTADAVAGRFLTSKRTKNGYPSAGYVFVCPITGRSYHFQEYDGFVPGAPSFSPTELKNYSVQGLATGDWHQFATGVVAVNLWQSELKEDALMLMTVHDSLLFDVKLSVMPAFLDFLDNIYKTMYKRFNEHFGTEAWELNPTWEVKVGLNWGQMKPLNKGE